METKHFEENPNKHPTDQTEDINLEDLAGEIGQEPPKDKEARLAFQRLGFVVGDTVEVRYLHPKLKDSLPSFTGTIQSFSGAKSIMGAEGNFLSAHIQTKDGVFDVLISSLTSNHEQMKKV